MSEPLFIIAAIATIAEVVFKPAQTLIKKYKGSESLEKNESLKINDVLEIKRREERAKVAKDLMTLVEDMHYAMSDIRRTFHKNIPIEQVIDGTKFSYQMHYDLIDKYSELFDNLHKAEIQARVVIGDDIVKEAVDEFFMARDKMLSALEHLKLYEQDKNANQKHIDELIPLRQTISNIDSKNNVLTKKIEAAVKTLKDRLTPIVRMEEEKETSKKK